MPFLLFALSALVLALEVLETKIFAYSLENSLLFLVVGVVLLGFGAGGSVVALRKELGDIRRSLRSYLFAAAVLLIVAHVWFAHFSDRVTFGFDLYTVSTVALLAAPYFCAGAAISTLLADPTANVHMRYGINLCGSAVGCLVVFFVLGPLTGAQCLVASAILVALLGVTLCRRRLLAVLIVALAGAPLFVYADAILPYQIQSAATAGQLALIRENAAKVPATAPKVQHVDVVQRFDRWDPTARVEVHSIEVTTSDPELSQSFRHLPSMWFTQDSSYGSPLLGRGPSPVGAAEVYDRTVYGLGHFRGLPGAVACVIGLGGAPDVQSALHHGVGSIDAVDINATAMAMVRGPMKEFLGDPYGDPRVTLHLRDGRSFVRSSAKRFDLIQLSGVDTKSVLASGTLALNESYLYTREAFDEYIAHLTDDGVLCIVYAGEQFLHRMLNTVTTVLRARGASKPQDHVMVVEQSAIYALLVKRTPFTAAECARMDQWLHTADAADGAVDDKTGVVVWSYELLSSALSLLAAPKALWVPDGRATKDPFLQATVEGRADAFVQSSPWMLEPAPDWRPFFFNIHRNADMWDTAKRPAHFDRMLRMLSMMGILAVALILLPLLRLGLRGVGAMQNAPFALYFAAIGAGYIMAMSGLIQRYVLFLGHQAYAFAVVVGGLLASAGVGSMLASRFRARPARVMLGAVMAIGLALAAIHVGLPRLFDLAAPWSLTTRVSVAVAALAPLGVPLGMMFPTGLAIVQRSSPLFVPWAFGINGVFSVIGTGIVLPGSILFGFPAMASSAFAVYVFAALVGAALASRRA